MRVAGSQNNMEAKASVAVVMVDTVTWNDYGGVGIGGGGDKKIF